MYSNYDSDHDDQQHFDSNNQNARNKPRRTGVKIHLDEDLVQIMADPEASEKAVWYGIQNDMLIMCNEIFPEHLKLAFSFETSIRYEVIRPDHEFYPEVMERLEFRSLGFYNMHRNVGQGIIIRLKEGVDPYEGIEDLQMNGMLLKAAEGDYDNDYRALLSVSASDIWEVSKLEFAQYFHPSQKRFMPYY